MTPQAIVSAMLKKWGYSYEEQDKLFRDNEKLWGELAIKALFEYYKRGK